MWMQLANRAFLSGASAHKGLPDNESQGMVPEPLVALPTDDAYDGMDDASESVHLINPSMNELFLAIHTANERPIIVTQPRIQASLQRGGRGNEEPSSDRLTFARMMGGSQDRINYYPNFVRDICSNVVAPDYMHRALSFDDLHFVGGDNEDNDVDDGDDNGSDDSSSSSKTVLWRVHSEGALITMPGNGNLAQQMAILNQGGPKRKYPLHPRKRREEGLDLVTNHSTWSPGYWITMGHILMVIACHRWGL
ncbi:uncharacterized protein [Drosophila kikkawai]|uniref:Uncharacterized protein n=1 Tax=Drosophila kikkawai TaxID=30033 RepID=A0A6P4I0K9_DROKI|nr:uncharacterized protein LOC108074241 [Drosophila kikkawai]